MNPSPVTTFVALFLLSNSIFYDPATASSCNESTAPVSGLFSIAPEMTGKTRQDKLAVTVCYSMASNAATGELADEAFLFDGETQRLRAALSWPLSDDWMLGADIAWVGHSGGFLDSLIDDWHQAFGLPDGIRDSLAQDNLRYELRQNGLELLRLTNHQSGLGDTRLHLRRRLLENQSHWLGAQLSLKLPSGRFEDLTGSGKADVTLALHWIWQGERLSLRSSIGSSKLGQSEFGDVQRTAASFLNASVAYRLSNRFSIDTGIGLRQSAIDSNLRAFSEPASALHMGLEITTAKKWRIRLGFSEDIRVESEPDIVFRLSLTRD